MIDTLVDVSSQVAKTPAQVAINWLLRRPGVTAPIIGARTMEQLEQNLGSVGWSLDEDQMGCLDGASEIEAPYPYSFIGGNSRRS